MYLLAAGLEKYIPNYMIRVHSSEKCPTYIEHVTFFILNGDDTKKYYRLLAAD